jgi:hypothetical protein
MLSYTCCSCEIHCSARQPVQHIQQLVAMSTAALHPLQVSAPDLMITFSISCFASYQMVQALCVTALLAGASCAVAFVPQGSFTSDVSAIRSKSAASSSSLRMAAAGAKKVCIATFYLITNFTRVYHVCIK